MNRILMGAGALVVIALAYVGWQSSGPSGQGHSMSTSDMSSLAEGEAIVEVSAPAGLSETAQMGARAFEAKCAECHGQNAAGRNGMGPPLIHPIYEPSHHSDAAIQLAVQNGVRSHHWDFGHMPPVDGLTRSDVESIARYIREMQRANGIE